ncbi:hypothetical protein OAF98_03920 [Planctomicrobium sp.]|nr:hypothetical protein [Planctomicrobium sp.]MDB4743610.1 hypothetical protein [Planctomicrobium sp.]
MKKSSQKKTFVIVQIAVLGAFAIALLFSNAQARTALKAKTLGIESFEPVPIPREEPYRVKPLYNRPDIVSDEALAAVLEKIQPRFSPREMKPNHIEHALRTWGVTATFQNPNAVSGQGMLEFLTDHGAYIESWGKEVRPILEEKPTGIRIRWGAETGASYHHDHWLACVTEAGASLNTPVYGPSRRDDTLYDVVQESLRDFRLDEREVEWTAMAFGLWIAPTREWVGSGGREYSFDLIAERLLRGHKNLGVCSGTHRVYSLMLLLRLDEEFDVLTDAMHAKVYAHMENVRDLIIASQFPDGSWPGNWPDGKDAVDNPIEEELYKKIISTGHQLEWLSIAPPALQPPEEQVRKAVDWIVEVTKSQTRAEIKQRFTFFSHVGVALANWRQVHPAGFWREWEKTHPYDPAIEDDGSLDTKKTEQANAH